MRFEILAVLYLRVFHMMVTYWAVMVSRETMRMIAAPWLDSALRMSRDVVSLHMVRNVWLCWSKRVKLGATTAIPIITPK